MPLTPSRNQIAFLQRVCDQSYRSPYLGRLLLLLLLLWFLLWLLLLPLLLLLALLLFFFLFWSWFLFWVLSLLLFLVLAMSWPRVVVDAQRFVSVGGSCTSHPQRSQPCRDGFASGGAAGLGLVWCRSGRLGMAGRRVLRSRIDHPATTRPRAAGEPVGRHSQAASSRVSRAPFARGSGSASAPLDTGWDRVALVARSAFGQSARQHRQPLAATEYCGRGARFCIERGSPHMRQ